MEKTKKIVGWKKLMVHLKEGVISCKLLILRGAFYDYVSVENQRKLKDLPETKDNFFYEKNILSLLEHRFLKEPAIYGL